MNGPGPAQRPPHHRRVRSNSTTDIPDNSEMKRSATGLFSAPSRRLRLPGKPPPTIGASALIGLDPGDENGLIAAIANICCKLYERCQASPKAETTQQYEIANLNIQEYFQLCEPLYKHYLFKYKNLLSALASRYQRSYSDLQSKFIEEKVSLDQTVADIVTKLQSDQASQVLLSEDVKKQVALLVMGRFYVLSRNGSLIVKAIEAEHQRNSSEEKFIISSVQFTEKTLTEIARKTLNVLINKALEECGCINTAKWIKSQVIPELKKHALQVSNAKEASEKDEKNAGLRKIYQKALEEQEEASDFFKKCFKYLRLSELQIFDILEADPNNKIIVDCLLGQFADDYRQLNRNVLAFKDAVLNIISRKLQASGYAEEKSVSSSQDDVAISTVSSPTTFFEKIKNFTRVYPLGSEILGGFLLTIGIAAVLGAAAFFVLSSCGISIPLLGLIALALKPCLIGGAVGFGGLLSLGAGTTILVADNIVSNEVVIIPNRSLEAPSLTRPLQPGEEEKVAVSPPDVSETALQHCNSLDAIPGLRTQT